MAAWKYVAYKKDTWGDYYYYWTNGKDTAVVKEADEVTNTPPSYADINYDEITDYYDGDIIAWIDDCEATRDSL